MHAAWPRSHPDRSITAVNPPAASPRAIVPAKKVRAKGHPMSPADSSNSAGLVSGEDTMKATSGAHGVEAAMPAMITAVVPHEQNGVRLARATAPTTPTHIRRRNHPSRRSVPT